MAVTNLLKTQVDQPVFEWMRPAPVATSAISCFIGSDITNRYMYYIVGQAMWRYDTHSDSWQETAPPMTAPTTAVAAKYAAFSGHRGHVISATSTTLTIAGLGKFGNLAQGLKIRIIAGTGAGQERTINAVSDGIIHDSGVATTADTVTIGDSTKKWRFNQWDAYSCRLTFSNGAGQLRKILYNNQTVLTFNDANFQPMDSFNNTGWSSIAPFTIPITTAGQQTHFTIESTELTVDSSWTVTPDASSVFQIMSGGIWLLSATTGSTPWATFQYYDILTDTWFIKTPTGPAHLAAALGTDFSIDRTGESGGVFVTGKTASSGTARTLVDTGETYERDRYANYQIRIVAGTGIGQRRRIVGHTADTFYVERKWDVNPDSTSQYEIYGNVDMIRLIGNGSSAMYGYSVESDIWCSANIAYAGVTRNISATPASAAGYGPPHEGFGVSGITYSANGVLTVAVGAGGLNYQIGDLVTLSTGGANATAYVTNVDTSGAVTAVQLANSGSGYTAGTVGTTGGSGNLGLTITITVGKVGNVTTATNHDFRHNDNVTIAGCATDTTFNGTFAIIGVGSLTTFSIANPSGTASPTAAFTQSTTQLVDSSANWDTNEHVGKVVIVQSSSTSPTLVGSRRITANTATTLTFAASTAATNGTSRYVIQEMRGFGAMVIDKAQGREPYGWASSGSATTLVDSTKSWIPNQYAGCRIRVISGTGLGNDVAITSHTATTITVASWNVATPDSTSKYEILDSYGIVTTGAATATITDSAKKWATNQLAGKRVRIVAGTPVGTEQAIASNTPTVITVGTALTTTTDTVYQIYEVAPRSTGIDLTWLYGVSDTAKKGRWLISPRGGGFNTMDIYDIPNNIWEPTIFIAPNTTTLSTGSMYAYDGVDGYFFTKDATNRVYELNLSRLSVNACGSIPYGHGGAVLGGRMEVATTSDSLEYLYIMRHSGQEMWRTLKFW